MQPAVTAATRKAGALTKLGRLKPAWPLGQTAQRRLRLLHSAFFLLLFPVLSASGWLSMTGAKKRGELMQVKAGRNHAQLR